MTARMSLFRRLPPLPQPWGLCERCDRCDRVRDTSRPLCRTCDPELARLIEQERATAVQSQAQQTAGRAA